MRHIPTTSEAGAALLESKAVVRPTRSCGEEVERQAAVLMGAAGAQARRDDDAAVRESLVWLLGSVGLRAIPFASAAAFLDSYEDSSCCCLAGCVTVPPRPCHAS